MTDCKKSWWSRTLDRWLTMSRIAANISIAIATLSALAVVAGIAIWNAAPERVTDANVANYCGWAGQEEAAQAWSEIGDEFPKFQIRSAAPTEKKTLKLWDAAKKVLGHHIPTRRQEVGDCVSHGAANAIDYLACVTIASEGGGGYKFRAAFPPYLYGISRVQVGGGRLRGDGSLGIWAAKGAQRFGVYPSDADGCPEYSGSIARKWGNRPGPPEATIEFSRAHLVKTVALVTTADEAAEALSNGYPVTVASDQGFRMEGERRGGKLWGIARGTWMHQMCFIAYDAGDDSFYLLNSWGPEAHGAPVDDAPPGGFWVEKRTVQRMLSQGDSFAWSQFDGFPSQHLDFVIGQAQPKRRAAKQAAFVLAN